MGRLCGGTHEISGIKAPLFLHGGWLEGSCGWVDGGWVGHGVWVVVGWVVGWVGGWVCGSGVGGGGWVSGDGVGGYGVVVLWVPMTPPSWGHQMPPMLFFDNLVKNITKLSKNTMGALGGVMGSIRCPLDIPMLFFGNLVKKNLTTYHCKPTSNIDIYPSILEMCINNLLKTFFLWIWTTPHPQTLPETTPPPPENHTYAQYFQQKPTYLLTVNV